MPLIIILFIGILAFGLFDFTLGRTLPAAAVNDSSHDTMVHPIESAALPSISIVAASETAHCDTHDTACELVALYRFVLTTVALEGDRNPWLHTPQHPGRTLSMKRGHNMDIALLLSSLLDHRQIRNYIVIVPDDSYVLACDISPSELRHATGNQTATPAFDHNEIDAADTGATAVERIDAYALNVSDAPCPCLLLDPSGSIGQQPGDPLPFIPQVFRSVLDLAGQRHALISSSVRDTPRRSSNLGDIQLRNTPSPM